MKKIHIALALILILALVTLAGCTQENTAVPTAKPPPAEQPAAKPPAAEYPDIDRESKIPAAQLKITPQTDLYPPLLHSEEYEQPVPMSYPLNTAGAEDSGFIMPDGNTFYVWFTPNPNAPLGEQLDDGVTGIYMSMKANGQWQKPERVWLQDADKQSLDGCEFVQGNKMWFCSARTGYTGMNWFTADSVNGKWQNWQKADFDPGYEVGELHISADGKELYFHSPRAGGKGQYDIWVSQKLNDKWAPPQNIDSINSPEMEGWPSLTQDGNVLWFTRVYKGSPAIFRSKKLNNVWQEPELIVSQFAGESSVDSEGNIYFTHHFYKDGVMLEADIYVIFKK